MDDRAPLISVAIVCFNAGQYLAQAIDSVLKQSFDDFELVIVDGGSTDSSLELIEAAALRSARVRWSSEPDEGLYDAMNKAVDLARGVYLLYLGADDLLEPGALEAIARAVQRAPRPDIVCGATRVFGESGSWDEPAKEVVRRGLAQRAPARHQSIAVRRELLRQVGGFATRYSIAADYDVYLKLVEAGATRVLLPERLSRFRLGGVSSTSALRTARQYRTVRVAHGANPLLEWAVMWKSVAASALFSATRGRRHVSDGRT